MAIVRRATTIDREIKMSKNEANKIKSHNFTRSTKAKSNIAIY